ncbi:hypothetical protein HOD38_03360 [archaeon]|jgi:hypothetical protein|nr:hypothetical protein [archaeon]MBT4397278.1 hypothetical protein [archaeon]MBT4440658.1 hypothetical protein [archaeon]
MKTVERIVEIYEEGGNEAMEALEQRLFDMMRARHFPTPLDWQMHEFLSQTGNSKHSTNGILTSDWFLEGPIRFFHMPGISDEYLQAALEGTQSIIDEIGLDLELAVEEYKGNAVSSFDDIPVLQMESVFHKLRKELIIGKDKASSPGIIFLANKPTVTGGIVVIPEYAIGGCEDTPYGRSTHGQGHYASGTAFMDVSEETMKRVKNGRPLDEIKALARHEVGHMLGIGHHEEYQVDGYEEWTRCVMRAMENEGNEVYSLCGKCRDGARELWRGAGYKNERRFLKDE